MKILIPLMLLLLTGCAGSGYYSSGSGSSSGSSLEGWQYSDYGAAGIYNKMHDLKSPDNPYTPDSFYFGVYFSRDDKIIWQPHGSLDPDQQPALKGLPLSESIKADLRRFDKKSFAGEENICADLEEFKEQLAMLKEVIRLYKDQENKVPWVSYEKTRHLLIVPGPMVPSENGMPTSTGSRHIVGEARLNSPGGYKKVYTEFGVYDLYVQSELMGTENEKLQSEESGSAIGTILNY